ncbi:MAG: ParB/RepB/Spo0J family partition protein, partial [Bacteroidota bacterium]
MARKKKEIGMGIKALLNNIDNDEAPPKRQEVIGKLSKTVAELPISQIETNPWQPRTEFDQEALDELSQSITIHGLIQPITVRRLADKKYQLISGERRLRASKMAGLTEVPAYIRIANDQEMLEMALVENIQRQNLNAIEVAITYQRLKDECALTDEKLADRVGKNRSTITNYLRLLKLPPAIQSGIKEAALSMGHARAIVGLKQADLQLHVFKEVQQKGLSVRQTEELISLLNKKKDPKKAAPKVPPAFRKVADNLAGYLGTKVNLKVSGKGNGQIVINFMNTEDLNRILELI